MATSSGQADDLVFAWDPGVPEAQDQPSPVGGRFACRPLEEYFDFLDDVAPALDEPPGARLLVDAVLEL